jgi:predicted transcriptional regulator
MIQLTKAEEQIMQILWELERATVQQLLEQFPAAKPARTTVSTLLSILENKGFAGHENQGKSHIYYPVISKVQYSQSQLSGILSNYFNNSLANMVSFFAKENHISIEELDVLLEETRKELLKENKHPKS